MNAHAQNVSINNYSYAICCNSSISNLSNTCGAVVLRLSAITNAHVQIGTYAGANIYPVNVCMYSDKGTFYCTYSNDTCPSDYFCVASIGSDYDINNETNAHIGPCEEYRLKVCCDVTNSKPTVNLSYPVNGDDTFINRTPCFNWTSYDADNDSLTYHFQLCYDSVCSSLHTNITGLTQEKYCMTQPLDLITYYWRVRAYDGIEYGNWSDIWNFTIVSYVSANLTNSLVNFGLMQPGTSNDTVDNDPQPFLIENTGNVKVNISVNATQLWQALGAELGTVYYQFKANHSLNEPDSFDWQLSQTTWLPFNTSLTLAVAYLNWSDSADEAALDIYVEAKNDEPPGSKNSTVTFFVEEA